MTVQHIGSTEPQAAFQNAWQKLRSHDGSENKVFSDSQPINIKIEHADKIIKVSASGVYTPPFMTKMMPGVEGLVPPMIALILAIGFLRIIPALLIAVISGAALQQTANPFHAVGSEFIGVAQALGHYLGLSPTPSSGYVGAVMSDTFNLSILGFTFVLVGMVALINRMGGTGGLVTRMSAWVRGPRSAQAMTALTGCALFFDDYANTVVVGSTGRTLTDRFGISREKLAYIVDSTSAPVAGVALLSTWIGYEVGLFEELLSQVPPSLALAENGYGLFIQALPFRFYCFFALALVFVIALSKRDFGPMLKAEINAKDSGQSSHEADESFTLSKPGIPNRARNALLPIVTVLATILISIIAAGPDVGQPWLSSEHLHAAFANPDLDLARLLLNSAIFGIFMASGLALFQKLLSLREVINSILSGCRGLMGAAAVLILAWSIKKVCDDVGTGTVILSLVGDEIHPGYIPLVVFIVSGIVAFSTGTSWGTMALMLPVALPLSISISADPVIVLASLAAVLDGAIWGDHCSPISDTTVLSSAASGCPHLAHVKTQIPYSMLAMLMASLCGYVYVGLGGYLSVAYAMGGLGLFIVVRLVGRQADHQMAPVDSSVV